MKKTIGLATLAVAALALGAMVNMGSAEGARPADEAVILKAKNNQVRTIMRPRNSTTLPRGENMGIRVIAQHDLQFKTRQFSYSKPIRTTVHFDGKQRNLTPGTTQDVNYLTDFFTTTVYDANGNNLGSEKWGFCPGLNARSMAGAARDSGAYMNWCGTHPFAKGQTLGMDKLWASPAFTYRVRNSPRVELPDGKYTLVVRVSDPYREALGLTRKKSGQAKIQINLRTKGASTREGAYALRTDKDGLILTSGRMAGVRSVAEDLKGRVPTRMAYDGPLPDLNSLPAYNVQVLRGSQLPAAVKLATGREVTPDSSWVTFNSTVWNSGKVPLVVDGFRRDGEDVMDAYQRFYDEDKNLLGEEPVGDMEWDPLDGHEHWHFLDFAQYSILSEDKTKRWDTGKESFCLANTDPINTLSPNVNPRPDYADLETACGNYGSQRIREVLYHGWGDTYGAWLPGQAVEITDIPNGTYLIETAANPDGTLWEETDKNNYAYRTIVLGGEVGGQRTIEVMPVGNIDK